jgi:hypothetical protein
LAGGIAKDAAPANHDGSGRKTDKTPVALGNNDEIMKEAMRAVHGRHVLAPLALHMQHS